MLLAAAVAAIVILVLAVRDIQWTERCNEAGGVVVQSKCLDIDEIEVK